jgi:transposase
MMGLKSVEPKLYLNFSLDAVVPANHVVRRLAAALDLEFVRALVRKHYSHTGQPSVDPVVLFKLWLLGYLFNVRSERRLCEEASLNLAWRWFVGYELDEPLPDHSVLTKARRRFGTRVYELFFRQIVRLCEARGLVQGDVLFLDSTLSDANAARDTLKSRALVESRLPEPRQFVADLFAVNDPVPEPAPPREKGGTGPKPTGQAPKPTLRRTLVSTTDPDAEVSTRHNGRSRLVYKTQVLVDGGKANIITAVDVGAAGDSDASSVGRMLDKHQVSIGRMARELVADSGYGSEAAARECLARQVRPILNRRRKGNGQGGFSIEDFTYVAERDLFVCPAGQELRHVADHFTLRRAVYRPKRGTCAGCALRSRCTTSVGDRSVWRSWESATVDQVRADLASRHGRLRLRQRQAVAERIIADLKCKHGFERAQFRGRASVQIQALLTATVVNLKQLLRRGPEAQGGLAAVFEAVNHALDGLHALLSFFAQTRPCPTFSTRANPPGVLEQAFEPA